ncbi:hypothetical protein E2C01_046649 [Portunus trituberculatus]|uniref:Uncharacterized protein n=1 Tax=Portunus trituberculatus TaxID=210409 RepID=A0A5B7FZ46_PORTR|nr:hypothetical protein [Portunus trituberculatus]
MWRYLSRSARNGQLLIQKQRSYLYAGVGSSKGRAWVLATTRPILFHSFPPPSPPPEDPPTSCSRIVLCLVTCRCR